MKRLALAALAVALVSGCGLKGDLERPAPWFGEARAEYEAEQARRAEEAARLEAEAASERGRPPAAEPVAEPQPEDPS